MCWLPPRLSAFVQMIVHKIGNAAKHVEATQAWIESATYSFGKMTEEERRVYAPGLMAALKARRGNRPVALPAASLIERRRGNADV